MKHADMVFLWIAKHEIVTNKHIDTVTNFGMNNSKKRHR